eukprot:CAMPEP_0119011822 /NCGR_PEP_ID=MMETSP1176-20130426/5910_1 /TAXON_ID=265551 /ORGANISM="Synedropsis recta cf, Strain CCMP1620" /LENGTH=148 /DNA_ID=CAMNT_0006964693 /DNA_START=60 /DNA_END=506 /DNA_ORIENTATION=+
MSDTESNSSIVNDPMGGLNGYFDSINAAKKQWGDMKDQIGILVVANQEMEEEYQAMKKENRSMKKDYQSMKEENKVFKKESSTLKAQKEEAEEYTESLATQVKNLSLENQVMKVQINTRKQMIEQAQSELGTGTSSDLFCGAARMIGV